MISDPIIGNNIPSAFQMFESKLGRFSSVRLTDLDCDTLWSIGKWDSGTLGITRKYFISTIGFVSAEEFVEMLMQRYPYHFEWFMFHPEWL